MLASRKTSTWYSKMTSSSRPSGAFEDYHEFRNEMDHDGQAATEIAAIEAELDRACWLKLRPWFLGIILFWVLAWGLTTQAATAPVTADAWDEDCVWWSQGPRMSDGSVIPAEALTGIRIERSASPEGPWEVVATVKTMHHCYQPAPLGTNHYRLRTVLADGRVSDPGSVLSTVTIAPTVLRLTTAETVGYQQNLGSKNKISLSRVASVPLGKLCVATMSLTDPFRTVHIIADRNWAVMDPDPKRPGQFYTRPNQVWAKCEAT